MHLVLREKKSKGGLLMARKSNTEILSKRRYTDTPQGRDVYNRQRLERGQMEDPQTMT